MERLIKIQLHIVKISTLFYTILHVKYFKRMKTANVLLEYNPCS